jgi:hypothetical protein
MAEWNLRFSPKQILGLVCKYDAYQRSTLSLYEDELDVIAIGKRAQIAGEYSREEFLRVCRWKTPRSQSRCRRNTPEEVSEITRIAFSTPIERLRIDILRCLHGVEWPTASVLLHLGHSDRYPILDVRAVWSWGFDETPPYTFEFWQEYVQKCRELAKGQGVSMRSLDRALWMYSKEHQESLR